LLSQPSFGVGELLALTNAKVSGEREEKRERGEREQRARDKRGEREMKGGQE
jgi:hypothetical protein